MKLKDLVMIFQEEDHARWVYDRVRGIDEEEVKPKIINKTSLQSIKTFNKVHEIDQFNIYVRLVCKDVSIRVLEYQKERNLVPKTLGFHYFDTKNNWYKSVQVSVNLQ